MLKALALGSSVLALVAVLMVPLMVAADPPTPTGACVGNGTAGVPGLDDQQVAHAATVIDVGRTRGLPDQAIVIAVATALQESRLHVYANDGLGGDLAPDQRGIGRSMQLPHEAVGSDHGSLGLFQQQWPWWGSMTQLMDPATSAGLFYDSLVRIRGWQRLPVTVAAQAVQHSAYPDAYADDEPLARRLLHGSTDPIVCTSGPEGAIAYPLPTGSGYVDQHNFAATGGHWASAHTGTDLAVACGTPVLAATDGNVRIRTDQPWAGPWLVQVNTAPGGVTTWYAHLRRVTVSAGAHVRTGDRLGEVGDLGNATGCHLHFEVHPHDGGIYDDPVDPSAWLATHVGRTGPLRLVTANIPFTLNDARARDQFTSVLAARPDVVVLQEVRTRPLQAWADTLQPGTWDVYQPSGGTALLWRRNRLTAVDRGNPFAFSIPSYTRSMPWVRLRDRVGSGSLAVIGIHMPTGMRTSPALVEKYRAMGARFASLVHQLAAGGSTVVAGGDWNHPLDRDAESWSAVPLNRSVQLTTNWLRGRPCNGSRHGTAMDGFAFPRTVRIADQGCLAAGPSDHRPVSIDLATH